MPRGDFVCHNCGEIVECSEEERPCEVLKGWLMVTLLKGPKSGEHYDFCSLMCLKAWVDAQVPQVPNIFLKAFEEEED
jgi:hypothetical protein